MILDRSIDLYLSMTWPKRRTVQHGICGHIFEIIDYYLLLKDRYNVGILIGEEIFYDYEQVIKDKYNLTTQELDTLLEKTTFVDRPRVLIGNNILFVDGLLKDNFQHGGIKLMFKNIFTFRCTPKSNHTDLHYKNVTLLQDQRIYKDDNDIAINYVKKLKLDRLRTIKKTTDNIALVYGTGNCRMLDIECLIEIINTYDFDKYLFVTNIDYDIKHKQVEVIKPPVLNLFEEFSTYIYTPTQKGFDCSSRLVAECKHYNKNVIYHNITDEYLSKDLGLKYRRIDTEQDMSRVSLTHNDYMIELLNEKL